MIENHPQKTSARTAGFTLVELLVVVAIVGMLASMAVPMLRQAMLKSKRNTAAQDLRVFRDAMHRYAADEGYYPAWDLDVETLEPIVPAHLDTASHVLGNLQDRRLDWYVPWDPIVGDAEDIEDIFAGRPQSFLAFATLAYDTDVHLIVTDGLIYYYYEDDWMLIPIGDN